MLYGLLVLCVLGASAWALLGPRQRAWRPNSQTMVLIACVVFALIMPRFKVYSYILVLIPALYLLRTGARQLLVPLAAVLVVTSRGKCLLPIAKLLPLLNE